MIGDCKLTSNENLVNISKNDCVYLEPEFSTNIEKLREELDKKHKHHLLHEEVKKSNNYSVVYTGFETKGTITDPETNISYFQRRIYVHSTQLEKDKRATGC